MQEVQISLKSIEDVKHFVQNIPALAVAIPADLSGRFADALCQFIYTYVTLITNLTQIVGKIILIHFITSFAKSPRLQRWSINMVIITDRTSDVIHRGILFLLK